jgi:hypothetical protein
VRLGTPELVACEYAADAEDAQRRGAELRAETDRERFDPLSWLVGGGQDLIRSESGQLREYFKRAGASARDALEMGGKGIMPIAGGATGLSGAAFMHNLPPEGTYLANTDLFFRETERNDVPQEQKAFTGLGGAPIDLRVSNVGILGKIRLIFVGSAVVAGGGSVTALYSWPWNILKSFTLNANGQTALISCEGLDLRARRQRIYRNPRDGVSTAPATDATTRDPAPGVIANGTYPIVLAYDIPIVHDDYTLTGALFAQSDQTYLSWRVTPAAASEVATLAGGSTLAVTGTIHSTLTFFDVPFADTDKGRQVLIPDLSWLHGYLSADAPFANTGDVSTPFIRTAGQLISYSMYLANGGAAQIAPSALDEIRFEYGGNRRPRTYTPPTQLLEKNVQDYNGLIQPGYSILDFEVDNPARDLVYPKGVTELKSVAKVPAATTVLAGSKVHFVEETLFSGA